MNHYSNYKDKTARTYGATDNFLWKYLVIMLFLFMFILSYLY